MDEIKLPILLFFVTRLGGNPDKEGKDLESLENGEELEEEDCWLSTSESEDDSEEEVARPPIAGLWIYITISQSMSVSLTVCPTPISEWVKLNDT